MFVDEGGGILGSVAIVWKFSRGAWSVSSMLVVTSQNLKFSLSPITLSDRILSPLP